MVRILMIFRYPLLLLLILWGNINSGYWQLREFNTPIEYLHAFRAFVPYILFPVGLFMFRYRPNIGGNYNPVRWLEAYGWVALFASALSQYWVAAFYFGVAFMANIYIPQLMFFDFDEENGAR